MDTVLKIAYLAFLFLARCHGNSEEDSLEEDQPLKFEGAQDRGHPRVGPNDAETEFHGVLMHGDDVRGIIHDEAGQMLPQDTKGKEPKDPNEAMHELMHGEEGIHKHAWDEETPEGPPSPPDEEQIMHGLLMHGDPAHGAHLDTDGNEKGADGVEPSPSTKTDEIFDPPGDEQIMHGLLMHGDINHKGHHDTDEEEKDEVTDDSFGPPDEERIMHGLLMHGDINFKGHHKKEEREQVKLEQAGPLDAEEQLHGVLMHGDTEPGHHHDHEAEKTEDTPSGPNGPDHESLHGILMHGDSEPGHDHSEEHKNAVYEVFKDVSKILELGIDEDILKIADIKSLMEKDKAEYSEYLATNSEHQDEPAMGSTYAYVSDTILSDIDMMKRKYLSKFGDDADALEIEAALIEKRKNEIPFTIDDIHSVLDPGTEAHEHEDNREHLMELAGSTEPINARHKMYNVLQESRERESKEGK